MERVSQGDERGPAQAFQQQEEPAPLILPQKSLLVLCGPAGAGKSTFARRVVEHNKAHGCKPTTIVSSDHCRALICDDETSQQANRDTFDLFHYIIHKRMFQNRFTIADSTALQVEARQRLLEVAQRHSYFTYLLVFNVTLQTCLEHDVHQARGRIVGEQVISYHLGLLQQALLAIPNEGWDQIRVLNDQQLETEITLAPEI